MIAPVIAQTAGGSGWLGQAAGGSGWLEQSGGGFGWLGQAAGGSGSLAQSGGGFGWLEPSFVRAIDASVTSPQVVVAALAIALAAGALHGLRPGHGKTVAAAYLVGTGRGYRGALGIGVAVAAAHTVSVLAIGGALLAVTRNPVASVPEPLLSLLPALLVTAIGVVLVRRHLRARRGHLHDHAHTHVHPDAHAPAQADASAPGHALTHAPGHGPAHAHAPAAAPHGHAHMLPSDGGPRGATLGVACFGGLAPSPAALLLMATGTVAGRVSYGLVLVLAFSVGLAASVALVGVAVLRGRDALARRAEARPRLARLMAVLPLIGAVVVVLAGVGTAGLSILRWVG